MDSFDGVPTLSRRSILRASGGAFGTLGVGTVQAADSEHSDSPRPCPDSTVKPDRVPYDAAGVEYCSDDHPATKQLQASVKESLETKFPTVGSLIDHGYVPYFDFAAAEGEAAWSHWLNPKYLGDDTVVDPNRPESILVDHKWWRPFGVMFIATRNGQRVDPPPAVYGDDDDQTGDECNPWHAHVGVPGRYAWLKYWLLFTDRSNDDEATACRTPWMMHTWAYSHPESVYAHHAPPRGNRGGAPAEEAGFETDAEPGEDSLSMEVLPDMLRYKAEILFGGSQRA
jgi:hypothetical protein